MKDVDTILSPKLSTEALITTLVTNEKVMWDVDIFDIPRTYLHAEMTKENKDTMKLIG